jgi:uncharacterized protein YecE (DUF72 family)
MSLPLFPDEKPPVALAGIAEKLPPGLHLGTCSWKYDDWRGLLYSTAKRINHLEEYARHLGSVEVDQWFWSLFAPDQVVLPRPNVVHNYAHSVPDGFRFSVKAPNSLSLTHLYRGAKADALVPNPHFLSADLYRRFLHTLEPLGEKLGIVMLQLEYLNRQKMGGLGDFLEGLLDFVSAIPREVPLAIESRNPNYLRAEYFDFLAAHDLAPVFCQGYFMPPVTRVWAEFGSSVSRRAVIRLMGPDREKIEQAAGLKWDRIIDDRTKEVEGIAAMVREMLAREIEVYVNVNNHYEGSAPLTIRKLAEML